MTCKQILEAGLVVPEYKLVISYQLSVVSCEL